MEKRGFTLAEIMLAIFITGLIFSLISGVYVVLKNIYQQTDSQAEITQNGRVILDRMVREIRQSPKISTTLPPGPDQAPNEIQFQDGHQVEQILYIRYYLEDNNLRRQLIAYYFPTAPQTYVYQDAIDKDPPHDPALPIILDDRLAGEYINDLKFWGDKLININISLSKNNTTKTFFTSIFGRNLSLKKY